MEMLHEAEFWEAFGFLLVLALLLWKGLPGMVGKMLDQRATAISAELDEVRRLSAEAAALLASYQQKAAGAEAEAAAILEDAKAEAARFAAESRAALAAQIERRTKAAEAAVAGAEKLIAARMDAAKASGLIKASIVDLGEKLN